MPDPRISDQELAQINAVRWSNARLTRAIPPLTS